MLARLAVSTPYSYSCKKTPKDAENQVEAALGAARAIKAAHGTVFTVGIANCQNRAFVDFFLQTGSLCQLLYKYVT